MLRRKMRLPSEKVGEFDAFIFTAAEYNRGPTGS